MTYIAIYNDNYLAHHGVKGMKWGVRRQKKREEKARRKREKKEIKEARAKCFSDGRNLNYKFDASKQGRMQIDTITKSWREYQHAVPGSQRHQQAFMNAQRQSNIFGAEKATYVYKNLRKNYSDAQIKGMLARYSTSFKKDSLPEAILHDEYYKSYMRYAEV